MPHVHKHNSEECQLQEADVLLSCDCVRLAYLTFVRIRHASVDVKLSSVATSTDIRELLAAQSVVEGMLASGCHAVVSPVYKSAIKAGLYFPCYKIKI